MVATVCEYLFLLLNIKMNVMVAFLLPLALFFDDVKAKFFYVICKSSLPTPSKELYLLNGMIIAAD